MQLPSVIRATIGLAAVAAEEARRLPERVIEVPMLAVSTALQASLRAQQHYARLTARGDELIHHRSVTDAPPAWATFDEPVGLDEIRRAAELAQGNDDIADVKPLRPARSRKPRPEPGA
jgi:hypothetical protein